MRIWIASLALVLASAGMSQTGKSTAKELEGSWTLVSWTSKNDAGETIHPYGEDAFGRIVYSSNGTMLVVLSGQGRASVSDSGFFAYSGGYTVDENEGTVTHHIEACSNPEWVGRDRTRRFEFLAADRVALRPVESSAELVWQREK